jgi:hypothetical protein
MTDQILTDEQILAAFVARSEGSPSIDLAERIGGATRRTRQLPRLVVLPGGLAIKPERLLWAAAISATSLALVGGLLFAGRQPDDLAVVPPSATPVTSPSDAPPASQNPSDSPAPSATPEATPSVDPTPSVEPSVYEPGLGPNVGAITLVGDLRVRSLPTVDASSKKLEPLLPAGARLYVIAGSVVADGYAWYKVAPFGSGYPTGWVAAGSRDGEPWLGSDRTACPATPMDARDFASLGSWGGVACYGPEDIEVGGSVNCGPGDMDNTISGPTWLRDDSSCSFVIDDKPYFFYPDENVTLTLPITMIPYHVTGHFSDTQSSSCVWAVDPPAPDPDVVQAICRGMFVVTDMQNLGID